jgi:hypothetical protein
MYHLELYPVNIDHTPNHVIPLFIYFPISLLICSPGVIDVHKGRAGLKNKWV